MSTPQLSHIGRWGLEGLLLGVLIMIPTLLVRYGVYATTGQLPDLGFTYLGVGFSMYASLRCWQGRSRRRVLTRSAPQ